jgi:cyclic beta-1,2-glucan synthetase
LPVLPESLQKRFLRLGSRSRGNGEVSGNEQPLRAELFSIDQLEHHARALAGWHEVRPRPGPDRLLPRLAENETVLLEAYELVTEAVSRNLRIAPAAEWLIDNFYLIEEQIRTARRHLPRGYSRELPQLRSGPLEGYPRVYEIALELISHVDGRVDAESLSSFVASYQAINALKLGELWAIPIMLRLALIENLRRVASGIAAGRQDRNLANYWADQLAEVSEKEPSNLILVLADMARTNPPMSSAFVAELARRLQGQHPSMAFTLTWIEQRVGEAGLTVEQMVQMESQIQAADQVSIGNSIHSLRFLGAMDWREFVETMSVVEHALRGDPQHIYARMDFATRDDYRHAVEKVARRSELTEDAVAALAVQLAAETNEPAEVRSWKAEDRNSDSRPLAAEPVASTSRTSHVGYWLIDRGLPALEQAARVRPSVGRVAERITGRFPLVLYLGAIALVTAIIAVAALERAQAYGITGWWLAAFAILPLLGAAHLAIALANWLSTALVRPRALPRLDFSEGIPSNCRTMVVVPTLLTGPESVAELLEALEVRHLANRDPNLFFALLTDLKDAPQEHMPEDEELIRRAVAGIEALNARYAGQLSGNRVQYPADPVSLNPEHHNPSSIFYLLHRPRRWNEQEGVWMGYERKRGKLMEFNALLRRNADGSMPNAESGNRSPTADSASSSFSVIIGETSILSSIKYVITLDSDTQLPRDSARLLVGTIAHPLNRPVFVPGTNRVVDGYTILQPRVAVSLPSANRSWFVRIFAGDSGVDPYTRAVSDVYQDVFDEGSFIGKGIYDVDAFLRAVDARFPENTILSHDLLEGCHARSGLASDVLLYEDHPARYSTDARRRHRWIRGDWQIAPWLLPWAPASRGPELVVQRSAVDVEGSRLDVERSRPADGTSIVQRPTSHIQWAANHLSGLSRWKIFDNLRRSLVPVALMLLILLDWLLAGFWLVAPGFWTLFAMGILLLPAVLSAVLELLHKSPEIPLRLHLRAAGQSMARQFAQAAMALVFLPYDAWLSTDAIMRTLWRMLVSRRKLLQWQTSSDAERSASTDMASHYAAMWICPVAAVAAGAGSVQWAVGGTGSLLLASAAWLLVLAWLSAPAVAWLISRPRQEHWPVLARPQAMFLRKIARKTWRFFETFVGPEDNWLPPDNFQEHPVPAIAHRTSSTNIGMAILSNLAAYDLGYISARQLLHRTERTLDTLRRMERYRGHLYNWYDTITLKPLPPLYISTVDNGNLAGHLLTLRPGLLELEEARILPPRAFHGLVDTLTAVREAAKGGPANPVPPAAARLHPATSETLRRIDRIDAELGNTPRTLTGSFMLLNRLTMAATELASSVVEHDNEELKWWVRAFERQCRDHLEDLQLLAPWVTLPSPPDRTWRTGSPAQVHRLNHLREMLRKLDSIPTLHEVAALEQAIAPDLEAVLQDVREGQDPIQDGRPTSDIERSNNSEETSSVESSADDAWFTDLRQRISDASARAAERIREVHALAQQCEEEATLDWTFLFDRSRDLLAIGFNTSEHRLDPSYYDLLASEARLASYIAIAQGQLPQEHWFALGRLLTTSGSETALLSWSGSMFEYLMPMLVMPSYEGTLLDQTCRAVVRRQIEYGRQRGVPWGVSESGYNTTDVHLNYQYRAFGVPGLGFKRGLAEDIVIAPYASIMALMVAPDDAYTNLERLAGEGQDGRYGFYEAVDYTPSRLPRGQSSVTVRSFMAHHQGMSLLSLVYLLLDRPMQRRFMSDPLLRATELLLQERIPRAAAPVYPHAVEVSGVRRAAAEGEATMRVFPTPNTPAPEVHLLSNGRYAVMITAAGGGYSLWKQLMLTRWREDPTRDAWGTFIYLRDIDSGEFWSTAYQPTLQLSEHYEAIFPQARAEFRRVDQEIESHTEISVSPEDDIELRRITLTNRSRSPRQIEVTSYAEVVLAAHAADATHPAFSNLFVQTELVRNRQAILCTRRPRSESEQPPWMLHLMSVHGPEVGDCSYETDRSRFIGRGQSLANPQVMQNRSLSNSEGSVLDPIVSIRRTVTIEPEKSIKIDIVTGCADTREGAVNLIEKYHDRRLADRVFELAWTHSQVGLRQLNAAEADAQLYGRLASSILYSSPLRRAPASVIARNRRGQSGLWGYGISGDLPIVLLRISDLSKMDLVRHAVQAHAYWRMKGLSVDLVIWNEDHSGYRQQLQEAIMGLIAAGTEAHAVDRPGGIFVRRVEQISDEDRVLMQTVARVILDDSGGTLTDQVERRPRPQPGVPRLTPIRPRRGEVATATELPKRDLVMFNGYGGFTRDGREYVITLREGDVTSRDREGAGRAADPMPASPAPLADARGSLATPAPWINVIANPHFGTIVSESGGSYTWLENSHEFRLTPWYNDAVCDTSGEAYYIRDEESGRFWSPTPLPARGAMPYVCRHGFGYTVFEYTENGISTELWTYVAIDAPIKFGVLKIRNVSGRTRRLSVTGYAEWVLAELRHKSLMHIVTELDPTTGAVLAANPYNTEFPDRVAFMVVNDQGRSVTADRTEFLGRNGSAANPAAMGRVRLSGRVGGGLDPCAAMQVPLELADGQEREVVFLLGAGRNLKDVQTLIQRFRGSTNARKALEGVWRYWNRTLGTVHVETPDPAVNFLANGWLLYQVLACRMWARTGFYQSGGAYGFRDQLQDSMALLYGEPKVMREHLLRCAEHQFREGDVQHWWHPPAGRGVRTHFSDDYLWLPYATCRYVLSTNDTGVLDEQTHFLEGRPVNPDEESYYDLPVRSEEQATLYEHCVRAIRNGLKFGERGLPLMGCGDWNDGMNMVGIHGKGESVWLAFFLYDVLTKFAALARQREDMEFAQFCEDHAMRLRQNIENNSWDGEWYRRAYFDNGEPLGSAGNPECQIDSLPQSWSVLTSAGDPERSQMGMEAVDRRLVRRDARLIQLFDPPFDKSHLNPGYIKGYVPGVRENGGQYTHAAIWTIMAFASMGDHRRAWELFNMINPINHGDSPKEIETYKVEPYVVAADVYAVAPHIGRGGWTWYTGSAGWMYRLITESLLGIRLEVNKLRLDPRLPEEWKSFKIHFRYRETFHHITINKPAGVSGKVLRVAIDGVERPDRTIPLVDDRRDHHVVVEMG